LELSQGSRKNLDFGKATYKNLESQEYNEDDLFKEDGLMSERGLIPDVQGVQNSAVIQK
jgi:hypothetical protein